jgi:hypothetical protein
VLFFTAPVSMLLHSSISVHMEQNAVKFKIGASSSYKQIFMVDFCLCGAILILKAFCFGAIPDIMIELIAYWSVTQSRQSWQWLSGIETKLLRASGYWQKKSWRWIHAYTSVFLLIRLKLLYICKDLKNKVLKVNFYQ